MEALGRCGPGGSQGQRAPRDGGGRKGGKWGPIQWAFLSTEGNPARGASVPTGVGAALGASTHPALPRGPGGREPRAGSVSSPATQPASASARSFFQLRVARELPHLQTKGDREMARRP